MSGAGVCVSSKCTHPIVSVLSFDIGASTDPIVTRIRAGIDSLRRHANDTPAGRQIVFASNIALVTTMSGTSAGADTLTMRLSAKTAVSIMSAIDGCRRRKFDVRNRDERTVLNLEIDRDDLFGKGHSELRDWDVARILLIRVERAAVDERHRERPIERPRRSHDVGANLQARDAV